MFNNARKVSIYNSNLISADTTHNHVHYNQDPRESLKSHVVLGALFNSGERYDPPKCHPETRVAILSNIKAWARGELNAEYPILWLRGAAGAGKSAIAHTLSETWSEREILAASFFFSRTGAGRDQNKYFIATLAYQLIRSIPMTRPYAEQAVSDSDGQIFDRPLQEQMTALVINPLRLLNDPLPTKIVVIDGLDECCLDYPSKDHEAQQREILEAIALAARSAIPLRFLIASRPERQIRNSFRDKPLYYLVSKVTLDNSQNPDADIELFLRCTFKEIRQTHSIRRSWPPEDVINLLVTKSSGHFVYASTVVRYISDPRADPERRLEVILGLSVPEDKLHNPFAQLDALYFYILESVQRSSLNNVLHIFGVLTDPDIFDHRQPFTSDNFSINFFSRLFLTTSKQIYCDLIDLHSILEVPPSRHADNAPIKFIHASFGEFLGNPFRSGRFYIDRRQARVQTCTYIAKNAIISIQTTSYPDSDQYSPSDLHGVLVRGVQQGECPPSKQLRSGIYFLTGRGDRRRNVHLESMEMSTVEAEKIKRWEVSRPYELVLLTYLQACNIEEIEKSGTRRWLVGASLMGQKARTRTFHVLAKPRTHICIYITLVALGIPLIVVVVLYFKVGFK